MVGETMTPDELRKSKYDEFGVFDDQRNRFQTFLSLATAEAYRAWLLGERRDLMEAEAKDPWDQWVWEQEQLRTYHIWTRTVTPWVPVEVTP